MKKHLLAIASIAIGMNLGVNAQTPALTYKGALSNSYLTTPKFINSTGVIDTLKHSFNPSGDYTLEVKATVNSVSEGRGMDIETRDGNGKGFRVSFDASTLNWSNSLSTPVSLGTSGTIEQTFRFAVEGSKVHIFQNGIFNSSKTLNVINDLDATGTSDIIQPNLVTYPDFMGITAPATATLAGWGIGGSGVINAEGGAGSRIAPFSNFALETGGTLSGKIFYTRWDGGTYTTATYYYYPVILDANSTYSFSLLAEAANSGAANKAYKILVSTSADGSAGVVSDVNLNVKAVSTLIAGNFSFTTAAAGTYYLTFKSAGTSGMNGITNLSLKKSTGSRLIIGKDYTAGSANMQISSITYDDGAYSPIPNSAPLRLQYTFNNVNLNDSTVTDNSGNGYVGNFKNKSSIQQFGTYKILNLGTSNGYLSMGDSITGIGKEMANLWDFTVSAYVHLDAATVYTGNGNFLWAFSSTAAGTATTGYYEAFRVNAQRYALATAGYNTENAIQIGTLQPSNIWKHLVYTQNGSVGKIYVDGVLLTSGPAAYKPYQVGMTKFNFLGKSPFASDNYLKNASVYDFRIYNASVSATDVSSLSSDLINLNNYNTLQILIAASTTLLNSAVVGSALGQYTQGSVDAFTLAIITAQSVINNTNAGDPVQFTTDLNAAKTLFQANQIGTKVPNVGNNGMSVFGGKNVVTVSKTNVNDIVSIYTLSGSLLKRSSAITSNVNISVTQGIYIVKVQGSDLSVYKVIVK